MTYLASCILFPGIGGSGRQSATRLATFMADYDLFQIEITRNYTKSEWREDVKKVILCRSDQITPGMPVVSVMMGCG